MSITKRFILILSGLMMGLAMAWLCLSALEKQAFETEKEIFLTEQTTLLNHWLQADAQSLLEQTRDIAVSRGQGQPVPIEPSSPASPQSLWELTAKGTLREHQGGAIRLSQVNLFKSADFLTHILRPEGGWFYFTEEQSFYQASFAPMEASAGWLFLVRKWDNALLNKLGSLAGGRLTLRTPSKPHEPKPGHYQIFTTLKDWRGLPLRDLTLSIPESDQRAQWAIAKAPTALFLGFGVIIIITLALSLHRWVITPLNHIRTSLNTESLAPIVPYLSRSDEIGQLAKLVEGSGLQREALRQSETQLKSALDERIRLGRNLHDGVIQSLYATGMVLATVQTRITPDDDSNRESIAQCRATLNESILDLRNFITGLEPEALKNPSFTMAVTKLLNFAETGNGLKTKCEINENLARSLSISQRAHVLQITREALSNAIRHGEATEVSTRLCANGSYVEFHFIDNGRGFSTNGSHSPHGHGLENLANRARDLGATFTVDSQPGAGTHLKLMFEHIHLKRS